MANMVGSGDYRYEVIEDWPKLPDGWDAPMAAVAIDSQDRVYGFNRGEHRVIVFDRNGNFLTSWGEGQFPFPHAIYADPHDNIWIVERDDCQIMKFTPEGELLLTIGKQGYRSDTGANNSEYGSLHEQVTHGGEPFNLTCRRRRSSLRGHIRRRRIRQLPRTSLHRGRRAHAVLG